MTFDLGHIITKCLIWYLSLCTRNQPSSPIGPHVKSMETFCTCKSMETSYPHVSLWRLLISMLSLWRLFVHASLWRLLKHGTLWGENKNCSNTAKFYCIMKQIGVHLYGIRHHPCAKFHWNWPRRFCDICVNGRTDGRKHARTWPNL